MQRTACGGGRHYSRDIQKPKTRREGFANFVQLIINHLEAGDTGEALLAAVDLLDTITGRANPYMEVTDHPAGSIPTEDDLVRLIIRAGRNGWIDLSEIRVPEDMATAAKWCSRFREIIKGVEPGTAWQAVQRAKEVVR